MIKTFRGTMGTGGQDKLRLSTIQGKVGYRIVKFEVMGHSPGTTNYESVVKIWKTEQSTIDGVIVFTDPDLLAAAYLEGSTSQSDTDAMMVIFESEVFNQDIFVTHIDLASSSACNYYIALEVVTLDEMGAEYTTLKDIRLATSTI